MEFRLPDAGEGLTEAEIVTWRVHAGDDVRVNQPLVEIETAKSLVELPSPVAGVVDSLLVDEGSSVPVGTPIIRIRTAAERSEPGPAPVPPGPAAAPSPAPAEGPSTGATERQPVLVGYGPVAGRIPSRRRPAGPAVSAPATGDGTLTAMDIDSQVAASPGRWRPLAKPPIRSLARDLGIDLASVTASGKGGVITRDDVLAARPASPAAVPAAPDAARRETRVPVRGVRKATAQAMVTSAFTAPHVTEWVTVDVTRSLRLLRRAAVSPGLAENPPGPLLLIARALLLAVRRNPEVNASWDEQAGQIVTKHYVDLGIAATTPRGLLVPVVRDADRLSTAELAAQLRRVVGAARDGSATPADLTGGTITITNVGVFGIDGGTPILPPGQAMILCAGQIATRPWVHGGKVRPREIMQLTASFDHRLIDGELGSRFLADVAAVLERPELALLQG